MKVLFFLYILVYLITLSKCDISLEVTKILSNNVASNGFLILQIEGLKIRLDNNSRLNHFFLNIQNINNNNTEKLRCYFLPFERPIQEQPRIGCRTIDLKPGTYKLEPLLNVIKLSFSIFNLYINPFNLNDTFEIIDSTEIFFYKSNNIEVGFNIESNKSYIDFNLFEPLDEPYLNIILKGEINKKEIEVSCHTGFRLYDLKCLLNSEIFPKDRPSQTYEVYIKEPSGKKKKNEFVLPINIIREDLD